MLLACLDMTITHPVSGLPLRLSAPLADDFVSVLDDLGWMSAMRPKEAP
jgi:tRNA pseudouridine65 synthase